MKAGAEDCGAELVLIDVGPNIGAMNRAALVAADFVAIPLGADLFSLQGLRNLGPTLRDWRTGWQTRRKGKVPPGLSIPSGSMEPLGYVLLNPSVRENRPVKSYLKWANRIPGIYATHVLNAPHNNSLDEDGNQLALIKHFKSLMPMRRIASSWWNTTTTAASCGASRTGHQSPLRACIKWCEPRERGIGKGLATRFQPPRGAPAMPAIPNHERLIVVMGMARSGTTIFTYVLCRHPQIALFRDGTEAWLLENDCLPRWQSDRIGRVTCLFPEAEFVVLKRPWQEEHVEWLHGHLPRARFIVLVRDREAIQPSWATTGRWALAGRPQALAAPDACYDAYFERALRLADVLGEQVESAARRPMNPGAEGVRVYRIRNQRNTSGSCGVNG